MADDDDDDRSVRRYDDAPRYRKKRWTEILDIFGYPQSPTVGCKDGAPEQEGLGKRQS
jgi:hypothetical protein